MQIEAGINPLTVKLGSLSLTFEPEVKESRPNVEYMYVVYILPLGSIASTAQAAVAFFYQH